MDDESGERIWNEIKCQGKEDQSELGRLVRGCQRETGSLFQIQGEAYRKERSVIRKMTIKVDERECRMFR